MYLNRYFSHSVTPDILTLSNFSDAIVEMLSEYQGHSSLLINQDFEFIFCPKESIQYQATDSLTSQDLEHFDITPILTTSGMIKIRESDSNLIIKRHSLYDDKLTYENVNGLISANNDDDHLDNCDCHGAIFHAFYNEISIYGIANREECLSLIPASLQSNEKVVKSVMFETAMYRAFQRLNMSLVSNEIKCFVSLHELRNFTTFHHHNFDENIFSTVSAVVDSRSDYLMTLSKNWSSNFQTEKSYFSYALTKIAVEHNLSVNDVKDEAYRLSEEVAFSGHSLSPVRGGIYIGCSVDEQGSISIYTSETVNGKVERCYAQAGLTGIFAENIYEKDECLVGDSVHFKSKAFTHSQRSNGEYVGVFAQLTFKDKSQHHVFIDKKEIYELANISTSDTWNGVFFERMAIKSAIKQAIDSCNWSAKYCGNSTRYC
ncbi:hypothetical protein UA32_12125 [Photobacterium angustum]|uniref:Uncharacterized protein n=1 Tax=Photobacterium angustum TaxID=661 RepID=A0ABX5GYM6_PHOAN|nr:recombinase RecT [Photobacterium angustum]KJG37703.1 hypothetical protein UA32_12125 [Photobacterium angustum]PSX03966.1 hypothetical protein C0W27_20955 [Photobacterium angustum]